MAVLDHAALHVEDLDAVCAFYTTHLGATQGAGYHNPRTGLRTYFLSFEGGGRLEVMARPGHCLLYTSPSPRDLSTSRMPSSA